jgi:hypothetical protein
VATPHVRIETQHGVAFGQVIKVVGSTEALGNWETAAAPSECPLCRLSCPWHRFGLDSICVFNLGKHGQKQTPSR